MKKVTDLFPISLLTCIPGTCFSSATNSMRLQEWIILYIMTAEKDSDLS
jgi:hypothetical protein